MKFDVMIHLETDDPDSTIPAIAASLADSLSHFGAATIMGLEVTVDTYEG